MADYYSECACLIEANPTQADILLEAMNELFEPDDSFIQKLISCDNTNGMSEMEIIVRHCVLNHPFRNVADIPEDLDWHFDGENALKVFLLTVISVISILNMVRCLLRRHLLHLTGTN